MTAPRSWYELETPVGEAARQAARLLVAGTKRPRALLATAAVVAAVLAAAVTFSRLSYAPELLLRVVEPDRDPSGMPRPRRQLAEYVRQAVFTSGPLLEMVRRHGLYPGLARKNPRAAFDSFKEDIEVDVRQNYFVEERPLGSAPRSARLSVSYHHANPEVAVNVTRDLARLIVEHELGARRAQATRAAENARREVDAAREALIARRAELAALREVSPTAPADGPRSRVAFVGLAGSLPGLEARQTESERREAALSLGALLERNGSGMAFEVVDDAALPSSSRPRSTRIGLAAATFTLGLPLMAMAVGAFARKRGHA